MGLYRGYIGVILGNIRLRVSQNHGLFLVIYYSTAPLRVPKWDPNFGNCPNRAPNRRPKLLNFWLGMAYTSKTKIATKHQSATRRFFIFPSLAAAPIRRATRCALRPQHS